MKKILSLLLLTLMLISIMPSVGLAGEGHTCIYGTFNQEFNPVSLSGTIAPGNFNLYLSTDTVLVSDITLTEHHFNLCLNGYNLDMNDHTFNISSYSSLNVFDCKDSSIITGSNSTNNIAFFNNKGTLTINGVILDDFSKTVIKNEGVATLTDVTISNCKDLTISNDRIGKLYINDCEFKGNKTPDNGGAIYNGGMATIKSCNFIENSAEKLGGAICNNYSGTIDITDCEFTDNEAKSGGAICNANGTIKITDCKFSDNSSTESGGAIYNKSTIDITDCEFTDNVAKNGGAISNIDSGTIKITDCKFSDNSSTMDGSVIINKATIDIKDCEFTGNKSTGCGALGNSGIATITDVLFKDNFSSSYGSAVYSIGGANTTYISDCTFENNGSSTNNGGTTIDHSEGTMIFAGKNIVKDSYHKNGTNIQPASTKNYGSVYSYNKPLLIIGELQFSDDDSISTNTGSITVESTGIVNTNVLLRDGAIPLAGNFENNGTVQITIVNDELDYTKTYQVCKKAGTGNTTIIAKSGAKYTLSVSIEKDGNDIEYFVVKGSPIEDSAPIAVPEHILESYGVPTVEVGEHNDIKIDLTTGLYGVNSSTSSAEAPIFIENGRTYLGVRDMANALGVDSMAIKWDDKTKTASISKSGATLKITQGSSIIKMTYRGYIYDIPTDASAQIRNDRIYLPFRVIFEIFGYTVDYDGTNRTITCK